MTEPGAGSDLQGIKTTAIKSSDSYVINGSKTFITNGQLANLIIVAVKTDPAEGAKGVSLIVVETDGADGFERGRNLHKIGMEANDTSELFFNDVKVPGDNIIGGGEGQGFVQLMQPTAAGTAEHRRPGHRRRRARAGGDAGLRQGAQGVRQADPGLPEHPVQAGRGQDQANRGQGLRRPLYRPAP
jgi:hypothetical protein